MDVKKQYGLNALVAMAALAGLLIFVNLLSLKFFQRFDFSDGQIYTVPTYTRQLLRSLEDPLQVKVYFSTDLPYPYSDYRRYIAEKLEEYQVFAGDKLHYVFIDPDLDPEVKKQMQMIGVPQVQLTDVSSNKLEVKNCYLGMAFYYQDKHEVIPYVQKTGDLDYKITSIIRKLTMERRPRVAIATGSVPRTNREMAQLIQGLRQQYDVVFIDLENEKNLDDLADALIVLPPDGKMTPWQFFLIDRYVMAGKGVAFFSSPLRADLQMMVAWPNREYNLNDLLQTYGVKINTDLLMDARHERISIQSRQRGFAITNLVNYPLFPNFTDLNRDQVIVSDYQSLHFPFVSTIEAVAVKGDKPPKFTWLVRSSAHCRRQTKGYDIDPYKQYDFATFNEGPFIVAATITGHLQSYFASHELPGAAKKAAKADRKDGKKEGEKAAAGKGADQDGKKKTADQEKDNPDSQLPPVEKLRQVLVKETDSGRLVVVGCDSFIKDDYLDGLMASFFFNTVDWLLQDEGLISIRSRGLGNRPLKEIDPVWQRLVAYANILLMPLLLIVAGLLHWRWRRRRIRKRVARLLADGGEKK